LFIGPPDRSPRPSSSAADPQAGAGSELASTTEVRWCATLAGSTSSPTSAAPGCVPGLADHWSQGQLRKQIRRRSLRSRHGSLGLAHQGGGGSRRCSGLGIAMAGASGVSLYRPGFSTWPLALSPAGNVPRCKLGVQHWRLAVGSAARRTVAGSPVLARLVYM